MYSTGCVMKLRPNGYDGYKKAHDELWPEIAASMSDHDVSMAIYRCSDRLFLFACSPTEADWDASREYEVLEKWKDYMREFLEDNDEGTDLYFEELPAAFHFGLFKED